MKAYQFEGSATVTVVAEVVASSAEEARSLLESGMVEWTCDFVDGEVSNIELCGDEDEDE